MFSLISCKKIFKNSVLFIGFIYSLEKRLRIRLDRLSMIKSSFTDGLNWSQLLRFFWFVPDFQNYPCFLPECCQIFSINKETHVLVFCNLLDRKIQSIPTFNTILHLVEAETIQFSQMKQHSDTRKATQFSQISPWPNYPTNKANTFCNRKPYSSTWILKIWINSDVSSRDLQNKLSQKVPTLPCKLDFVVQG